jgi:hypothetical protein
MSMNYPLFGLSFLLLLLLLGRLREGAEQKKRKKKKEKKVLKKERERKVWAMGVGERGERKNRVSGSSKRVVYGDAMGCRESPTAPNSGFTFHLQKEIESELGRENTKRVRTERERRASCPSAPNVMKTPPPGARTARSGSVTDTSCQRTPTRTSSGTT